MSKMMLLKFCCMFFCMSVAARSPVQQIEYLNATFPCGKLSAEQKCRIPFEYCDVILESCLACNEDICKEESQQSCNIFCSDFKTEENGKHVETESHKHVSLNQTSLYVAIIVASIFFATTILCLLYICHQRFSKKNNVTPVIAQPTDDNTSNL